MAEDGLTPREIARFRLLRNPGHVLNHEGLRGLAGHLVPALIEETAELTSCADSPRHHPARQRWTVHLRCSGRCMSVVVNQQLSGIVAASVFGHGTACQMRAVGDLTCPPPTPRRAARHRRVPRRGDGARRRAGGEEADLARAAGGVPHGADHAHGDQGARPVRRDEGLRGGVAGGGAVALGGASTERRCTLPNGQRCPAAMNCGPRRGHDIQS